MVGKGSFSQVFAVEALHLKDQEYLPQDCTKSFAGLAVSHRRQRLVQHLHGKHARTKTLSSVSSSASSVASCMSLPTLPGTTSSVSSSLSSSNSRYKISSFFKKHKRKQSTTKADTNSTSSTQKTSSSSSSAEEESPSSSPATTPKLVVKHLNRKLLQRPLQFHQAVLHMERETQILAALSHPHIVKLRATSLGGMASLQSGRYNDFFIVMDYLHETLQERLYDKWGTGAAKLQQEGAPPKTPQEVVATIVDYGIQLASALEHLHERRLVFRDVKPANIGFLSARSSSSSCVDHQQDVEQNEQVRSSGESIQLFDFGFCRSLPTTPATPTTTGSSINDDDTTFHMSMAGTTRYMSPEMLCQEAYNTKTDVYSFGLVFYEMLARRKPFEGIKPHHFAEFVGVYHHRPKLTVTDLGVDGEQDASLYRQVHGILEHSWCASMEQRWTMTQVKEALLDVQEQLLPIQRPSPDDGTSV